jgi:hypothetical protein
MRNGTSFLYTRGAISADRQKFNVLVMLLVLVMFMAMILVSMIVSFVLTFVTIVITASTREERRKCDE